MPAIRKAKPGDAERLARVAERTFREAFAALTAVEEVDIHCRASFGEAVQAGEISNPNMITLLAEEDGCLVGFAQLRWSNAPVCVSAGSPGEIQRLYVLKEWHGKGVAQALMNACLEAMSEQGSDVVWLGVWEHNPRAISFYRKYAFVEVGEQVFTLGREAQRDIIMARATVRGKTHADYFAMNRAGWDQRVKTHVESRFYDVDGFLSGNTSLREIELAELADVRGRKLLHLQCHFGLDTLSWARRGAICTGVDISPVAIRQARELAERAELDAEFVCSDVYGFVAGSAGPYDIVYTSYGAICWLPDLDKWAEVVASSLAPGGMFYIVEFHPIHDLLAGYSYFTPAEPGVEEEDTYTENGADVVAKFAVWAHPLSSVVNALVRAGIRVERLNEFPFSPYNCFEGLVEREPGRYYLSHRGHDVPMVYSLTGRKVA